MYLNEEFETLLTRVEDRLTVTLDVFKSSSTEERMTMIGINSNIRCI